MRVGNRIYLNSKGLVLIQAITFDFWNTLYWTKISANNERINIIEKVLTEQGYTLKTESIEDAVKKAWNYWDEVWLNERRTANAVEWFREVLKLLNVSFRDSLIEETAGKIGHAVLSGISEPAAGSVETIKKLSKKYKLGIISDTGVSPSYVLKELLSRAGIIEYFNVLVFSDEFGMSKPDKSVFMHALELLDVEPEAVVHVGDLKRTDMEGAASVGMYSVRYAGVYDDVKSGFCEANGVIYDFSELESAVSKLTVKN